MQRLQLLLILPTPCYSGRGEGLYHLTWTFGLPLLSGARLGEGSPPHFSFLAVLRATASASSLLLSPSHLGRSREEPREGMHARLK